MEGGVASDAGLAQAVRTMLQEPATYRPDTPIAACAPWLSDSVEPARFPQHMLRVRNDRAAAKIGLAHLSDEDWIAHFARFEPLPHNLPVPLALRYHGHQFRTYNPEIGDGRGFLFAQLRDREGRLMDLGTKGSGQTPYSRFGDGRLTLQGAVREYLATEMLEALGVNTSRTFSMVETGEKLARNDEPSPTRSAVLVRLSHGHIRIGSFQRLAALRETEHLGALVDYCVDQFPGPPPPDDAPGRGEPAVRLMHQVVERLADLAASYMVAGFVHGVLNTDNMNVTGESFDYGPWRFLPAWQPGFTAAYFDHAGLYAFGRQPEAIHWNCGQLAVALRPLVEAPPLIAALERFAPIYQRQLGERWCWRLGVASRGEREDAAIVAASERLMQEHDLSPDEFFHRYRGGHGAPKPLAEALGARTGAAGNAPAPPPGSGPVTLVHTEVDRIWSAIAERDDWSPLQEHVARIRTLGSAIGPPPEPLGHARSSTAG
jgi:uncharacterized protein YdiU (UPF0061 family)